MEYVWWIGTVVGGACIWYACRFWLRRWWRGSVVNRTKRPHERWPEVLQWRPGDDFDSPFVCWSLVSITSDGYAVLKFLDEKQYVHLSRLVRKNASARTRRIDRDLAESNEYMELLSAFNESVAELQERDKKMRLVS